MKRCSNCLEPIRRTQDGEWVHEDSKGVTWLNCEDNPHDPTIGEPPPPGWDPHDED
jgi:hypothetical protein